MARPRRARAPLRKLYPANSASHTSIQGCCIGLWRKNCWTRIKATSDKAAAVETARSIKIDDLSASGLRKPEVSREASKIAAVPEIRDALIGFQCRFAERKGGAVLDGRDIGTVVCPRAEVKLFVTANEGVRARRRHRELLEAGEEMTLSEVLEDLRKTG